MRNIVTNIAAFLLVLWYSLCIIGFDVHTCNRSGRTYIATVVGGTACEDIHPCHDNTCCSCCHPEHSEAEPVADALTAEPCCSDDWQMILLTGVRVSNGHDHSDEYHCGLCPCVLPFCGEDMYSHTDVCGLRACYKPGPGNVVPLDVQREYNIWRI